MNAVTTRLSQACLSRYLRSFVLLTLYASTCTASLWLAYLLRFDFAPPSLTWANFPIIALGLVVLKLVLLWFFGQFESLLTYFSIYDVRRIFTALLLSACTALGVWFITGVDYAPPRAVILADFLISFLALAFLRTSFRLLREGSQEHTVDAKIVRKHIGIIGAGDVGVSLAKELVTRRALGMQPVAFFDDDQSKWRTHIFGIPVKGPAESIPESLKRQNLDEVVIAMPGATGKRVREIVKILTHCGLRFATVPSLSQLVTGKVRVSQVRPVEIQDLLGRGIVDMQVNRIRDLVRGKIVLVTGAGGSIGAELCRQLASHDPKRLLLVERCEVQLFQIEQELIALGYGAEIVPFVADILDAPRLRNIFERFRPQIVFHAAAHKHVPMMEHQPAEALRNNTLGTRQIAELSAMTGVQRFVLVSTDKAINPTNVMGATKRMAELFLQSFSKHGQHSTKFMAVRFGNVLGSSGSVIPTFKKQIAAGGPVTVTHPDVTRYFMTVNEAVGLVLQSATLGLGGEIFVLDMGQPMKILDLAKQLIELSGLEPNVDIDIQFTGLRPGEKLYEELNHNTENMVPTEHPKIMRFLSDAQSLDEITTRLDSLQKGSLQLSPDELKRAIQSVVPEYQPHLEAI